VKIEPGRTILVTFLLSVLACLFSVSAKANLVRVGGALQVDTAAYRKAVVASAPSGEFVVVWEKYDSYADVFAQRFDATLTPLGTAFRVNTYTTGRQLSPAVSMKGDGSFVVAWTSTFTSDGSYPNPGQDGSSSGVFAQRYDVNDAPLGTEFLVNSHTLGLQDEASVSFGSGGDFVIVWQSGGIFPTQDGDSDGIFGQRYDGNGDPMGSEFQLNVFTTGRQLRPAITSEPTGEFIVVWQSPQDGHVEGTVGRRFDSLAQPLGGEFQVNNYTTGSQHVPVLARGSTGQFVIAWEGDSAGDYSGGISARLYDSFLDTGGPDFQVNAYTTFGQHSVAVAVAPDDSFLVAWINPANVFARHYDGQGVALGSEFLLNTDSAADVHLHPAVAALPDSGFVVTYTTYTGVAAQRLAPGLCGPAPLAESLCRIAAPGGAGSSLLQLKDSEENSKDALSWIWKDGEATSLAAFGAPDSSNASYRLCIYDGSALPQPLLETDIPAGGIVPLCDGRPCWRTSGPSAAPTGYRYRNKQRAPGGVMRADFKSGSDGDAQVRIKGRGALLGLPALDLLSPQVTLQLLVDDGLTTECFQTKFPGAGGAIVTQSDRSFKATGP
jgi:hypothetical protein